LISVETRHTSSVSFKLLEFTKTELKSVLKSRQWQRFFPKKFSVIGCTTINPF
jgi:hypothetical protein